MKNVLVVGAGLGGLAAAIRLAKAGFAVEVWERNAEPGGKLKFLQREGFTWGTGPSLLTMPQIIRDLYRAAGEEAETHLDFIRLPSACRYFWTDGTVIDEDEAFWRRTEVARFLQYARGIYELSGEAYLNHPPGEFWRAFTWRNLGKLRHLAKVATTRTLAREVERRLRDPHLQQIFLRFATYNGSSPYRTPATFNIIPFVEAEFGAWYLRGGLPRLSVELTALAQRLGVTFRWQTTATRWQNGVATAHDGTETRTDYLVCNQDVLSAATGFLAGLHSPAQRRRLLRPALSTSGLVFFFGIRGIDPRLSHHNIFFTEDYPREFAQIHEQRQAPTLPTIYVAVSSRTDPDHAPAEHDNYFVLVNVPARDPQDAWTLSETFAYRDLVLQRLERFGLAHLRRRIVTEGALTPTDFAQRDLARFGALYGWASHSIGTSLLRPPLRSPRDRRVFYVGGTTHPGGGIPLVLLSGKMVAEAVHREAA